MGEKQVSIVWHVADPEEFWDSDTCPIWAKKHNWDYADGSFIEKEAIYAEVDSVLARYPKLQVMFAHFYFLSDDLPRAVSQLLPLSLCGKRLGCLCIGDGQDAGCLCHELPHIVLAQAQRLHQHLPGAAEPSVQLHEGPHGLTGCALVKYPQPIDDSLVAAAMPRRKGMEHHTPADRCFGRLRAQDEAIAAQGHDGVEQTKLAIGARPGLEHLAPVKHHHCCHRLGGTHVDAGPAIVAYGTPRSGSQFDQCVHASRVRRQPPIADHVSASHLGSLQTR